MNNNTTTSFVATKLVKKSHIGRPVEFLGYDGNQYNGRIVDVRRGFAEINYPVRGIDGEVTALVRVREKRLMVW